MDKRDRDEALQGDAGQAEAGQAEAQRLTDEAEERGYIGSVPDPTPNENYTVGGVTSGAPTPETDADLQKEAREAAGIGVAPLEQAEEDNAATAKKKGGKK